MSTPTAIDPTTSAVAFIECQVGVIGEDSMLPALAQAAAPAIERMAALAAGARDAGVPVLHLTYHPIAGGRSNNRVSPLMRATTASADWDADHPSAQVIPEIGVADTDLVIPRHSGISPVAHTEVLPILRNMGVTTLVAAGVSTNWAIPLTIAAAADDHFTTVVPVDATTGVPVEHHESMLQHALGFVAKLMTVDELLAAWAHVRADEAARSSMPSRHTR